MVMAVMPPPPRESWTDDRLDDFKDYVAERFDRSEADIRELRQAVNQLQRTMVIGFIGLAGLIVSAQLFF
jgi:hypothetical protein